MSGRRDGMGGSRGAAGGSERERLGELLRTEAAQHTPDRDRIRALMAQRGQSERDEPATVHALDVTRSARDRRELRNGRDGGRRRPLAWPLAAAGVAVLMMATVAGARVLGPGAGQGAAATPATGQATLGPARTIDRTPITSGPPTSATGTTPTATGPSAASPGTGPRQTSGPTGGQAWPGSAVSVKVTAIPHGTQLSLPRAGDRDWIVVGGRRDGRLVRAESPTRTLGTVTVSGYGPSVVDGPFRLAWQRGAPEQDRTGDITWQSITAVDGRLRITVPLRGDRFTVDLYAGTVRTTGLVTVRVPGSSGTVTGTLVPCGGDVCPDLVSITVDSARLPGGGRAGDLVIDLGPARPGDGLGLGLAAVVLR